MKHQLCCPLPVALALVLTSAATSCIYEDDDCPEELSITIQADWTEAPEATPEGMAYIFFPTDGSEPWRFDFPGREGGKVSILTGDYRVLSFNDDTYHVLFRGTDNYDSYEAYTNETSPQLKNERTVESPDMMWGCAYSGFNLTYCGVWYASPENKDMFSPEFVFTARQRAITPRYTYTILNVKNLSGVKSMSATLSGMAGSMFLASKRCGDYPSTLSVKAAARDSTSVEGQFHTFGIPQSPSVSNILSLFAVLKDGRRFCYEFDVTDQIRNSPDPMNVNILLDGLSFEHPEGGSGTGFEVNVDGWQTIIVNING